jgi:hypothetical protein
MKHGSARLCVFAAALFGASHALLATAQPASPCSSIPHSDHPSATLTNGETEMVVFLPDAANGYYRSSRFDWSGAIACASFRGHRYFGEWFDGYDPLKNDAITGPVEEFRAADGSEFGYAEAAVGGEFMKPGVGVLKKIADTPYSFGTAYPIVDNGTWTVKVNRRSIVFTQVLKSRFGYAYRYTKVLELDAHAPVFHLKHTLTNLGTKPINTNVYDHDFFMLDDRPTSAEDEVTLGFAPVAEKPLGDAAEIRGHVIAFTATPDRQHTASGYITGYTGKQGEYSAHLVDKRDGIGILQTSSSPVAKMYFWSTAKTICPELYIAVHAAPGSKQTWDIRYELEAPAKESVRGGSL